MQEEHLLSAAINGTEARLDFVLAEMRALRQELAESRQRPSVPSIVDPPQASPSPSTKPAAKSSIKPTARKG